MSSLSLFGIVLVLSSVIPIGGGLFVARLGRQMKRRSAAIEGTASTAASDVQPGKTEVRGTAWQREGGPRLLAPISNVPALATTVRVERFDSHGSDTSGSWTLLYNKAETVPFTLDDGTGQVLVDPPESAELLVELDQTRVRGGQEPPTPIREFVERERTPDGGSGFQLGPLNIGDTRRYTEGYIQPQEDVYVLGRASKATGWDGPDYVVDTPTKEGEFILSNKSPEQLITESSARGSLYYAVGGFSVLVGVLYLAVAVGMIFLL